MKKVEVVWKDITSDDGWRDSDELDEFVHEDNTVRQLGYLYEDDQDDDKIILLDSYFDHKKLFGGVHKIPRGCIISITELKAL